MGGLEKVQLEYINFLFSKGYEIKVIIDNDNGPDNKLEHLIQPNITYLKDYDYIMKIRNARDERKKNILKKIKYNFLIRSEREYSKRKFLEIYNDFKPDIVIDFDSSLIKFISELKTSKNLVWIHSSVSAWKKKQSKIDRFTKGLENYTKVVCICKEMKEELEGLNSKLKEKITYIYNPIDFNKIKDMAVQEFEKNEKELVKNKFLLTVARLDLVPKDFDTLFKGFDIAKDRGYDGKLYIIGDGPDKEKVEESKENSRYKNDIYLLGRKMNPYKWMKKADKFIMSSRYEGYPTVLLEALALEKKIISSNCKTGPKEILKEGKFGDFFEIGDDKSLAEKIVKDVELDKEKLEKHMESFNIEKIYTKFLKILEE
jgi:glycosyltransferase involved in cell wall biosynthesis